MAIPPSFQKVTRDVLDLCELQLQLLSVDSQAARRKLSIAVGGAVIAATLSASALTVCIVGLGYAFGEATSLSTGQSLIAVSLGVFILSVVILLFAASALRNAAAAMSETKAEFSENLRWLKATLLAPSSSPRNQFRSETFHDGPSRESRFEPEKYDRREAAQNL